jgi:hypothetical protein
MMLFAVVKCGVSFFFEKSTGEVRGAKNALASVFFACSWSY